ncbi:MAG: hypothetical protein DCC58_05150 [Chloroflexi bacterium]|nr:MAG: hypothetical protein DCC58_05150 [Chloroflexota bacterium]
MRALIIARGTSAPPPERMVMIADAFKAWREQHRDRMEEFSWFPTGNSGCAIVNVAHEAEILQITSSYPLTPYSDMEVQLLIDGDAALDAWHAMIHERAGG